MKRSLLAMLLLSSVAYAQNLSFPLKLEPTQTWQVRFSEGLGNWTLKLNQNGDVKGRQIVGTVLGRADSAEAAALMITPEDVKSGAAKASGLLEGLPQANTFALFAVALPNDYPILSKSITYRLLICMVTTGSTTDTLLGKAFIVPNKKPAIATDTDCYATKENGNPSSYSKAASSTALGWPIELQAGQEWILSNRSPFGAATAKWNIKIDTAQGNTAKGTASGLTNAPVDFQYFDANHPRYPNTLAMQVGAERDPKTFICLYSFALNGYTPAKTVVGKAMVSETLCELTAGKLSAGEPVGSTSVPAWLVQHKRQPVKGENWLLNNFQLSYQLNFDQPQADGWSGKAVLVKNETKEQLPTDWTYRLIWMSSGFKLDVVLGGVTFSCMMPEQGQNVIYGSLSGDAELLINGQKQQENPCSIKLF